MGPGSKKMSLSIISLISLNCYGKKDPTLSTLQQLGFTKKNCFAIKLFTVIIIYNVRYLYVKEFET